MKQVLFPIIMMGLLILSSSPVYAQGAETIEYGQTVQGEITDRDFEVPFNFQGKAGDILVIEMNPVESLGDLTYPEIILINSDGRVLADSSGNYYYRYALVITQLDSDDTYTILASRADGRAGDSVGDFTLELIYPPLLVVNEALTDTISSEDGDHYFLIDGVSSTLNLTYQKIDGDFAPRISLNRANRDFGLTPVITITGSELTRGIVNIPASDNIFVVTVGSAPFAYFSREVTAEYQLKVTDR